VVEVNGGALGSSNYSEGYLLRYECAGGYVLVDRLTMISVRSPNTMCNADGNWTSSVICVGKFQCSSSERKCIELGLVR